MELCCGARGGTACYKDTVVLVVTELLKWVAIVTAIYLSVWRYCVQLGQFTVFVPGATNEAGQFWGVFTAIIVGVSLILYLPSRVIAFKLRYKYHCVRDERWKPAILAYILLAAVPGFTLVLNAYQREDSKKDMDPVTITVLQVIVLGLVLTEWMVKIQQEIFAYNLLTAMALDFFFAYDVIAFIMMASATYLSQTDWIYPCFIFAVVAMFKYLPTQPIKFIERQLSIGHIICILTSLLCNDIPFVVIRLATIIIFENFLISDLVFLVKNFFVIIFNCIQLVVIFYNRRKGYDSTDLIPELRMFRGSHGDVWKVEPRRSVLSNKVATVEDQAVSNNIVGHANGGLEIVDIE